MINALDPLDDLTFLFVAPASVAANTNGLIGILNKTANNAAQVNNANVLNTSFMGKVAVVVNVGAKTVGDSNAVLTPVVLASATNNFSNATNNGVTPTAWNVSNNATGSHVFSVDTRGCDGPYLFYGLTVAGTNSPAWPVSVVLLGTAKLQ